jgi:hypothetical protein
MWWLLGVGLSVGCVSDAVTAPSNVAIPITSISYQRERAVDIDGAVTVTAGITFPNDTGRPVLRGCVLAPTGPNTLDCGSLTAMACKVDVGCPMSVSDPAINRGITVTVASGLSINGQRLSRIDTYANGNQIGFIRFDRRGQLY